MTEKENNLMVYLKKQMEEYQEECESNKALYADLLEHIEECRDQIRKLEEMEDPGFALLSPLAKEEKENAEIMRLAEQIAGYEKQKQKYLHEIRFYEEKVSEMQEQLDKFADNEAKNQAWKKKLEEENAELVAAARAAESAEADEWDESAALADSDEWDESAELADSDEWDESAESDLDAPFLAEEAYPDEGAYDGDDTDAADDADDADNSDDTGAADNTEGADDKDNTGVADNRDSVDDKDNISAADNTEGAEDKDNISAADNTEGAEDKDNISAADNTDSVGDENDTNDMNDNWANVKKAAFVSREQIIKTYDTILRRLTEMKGYAQLDPRRCKIELESLMEYVEEQKQLTEE